MRCIRSQTLSQILRRRRRRLRRKDLHLSDDAAALLPTLIAQLAAAPGWGNGRDVNTLAKGVYKEHATRCASLLLAAAGAGGGSPEADDADDLPVSAETLTAAVQGMLKGRQPPGAGGGGAAAAEADAMVERLAQLQRMRSTQRGAEQQRHAQPPAPAQLAVQLATAPPPAAEEQQEQELDEAAEEQEQLPAHVAFDAAAENLWDGLPQDFLAEMQDLLTELGLNSAEGTAELATLSADSPRMRQLAAELAFRLGVSTDRATELLLQWQQAQGRARAAQEAQAKEEVLAKQQRRKALVPIWRCAICGRADLPYIACYVSPYIVRYQAVDAPGAGTSG